MKIQINDTNYFYYKSVFEIIWSHHKTLVPPGILDDDSDPIVILNRWEQKSMLHAKRYLKAGLQDFISGSKEFPPYLRSLIDNDLAANELPGLKDFQRIVKNTIASVLQQKKIDNLEEFQIVKEEVNDESSDLTNDTRILLDKLLTVFELSQKRRKGKR